MLSVQGLNEIWNSRYGIKITALWEMVPCSFVLIYQTPQQRHILEDCNLNKTLGFNDGEDSCWASRIMTLPSLVDGYKVWEEHSTCNFCR
jgi:hypothetical protein